MPTPTPSNLATSSQRTPARGPRLNTRWRPAGRLRLALTCLLACGSTQLAAQPAQASQLRALDTAELVARAGRIFVGRVEGQQARWVDEDHSAIVTDVRILVTRAVRGPKEGEVVTVRRLGGTVDGIGMRVVGEAGYQNGEELMLFTERRGDAHWAVGMSQGKLHVATEAGGKVVYTDLMGAELLPRSHQASQLTPAGEGLQEAHPPGDKAAVSAPRPRPLDDLLREVSDLAQRIKPPSPVKIQSPGQTRSLTQTRSLNQSVSQGQGGKVKR